MTNNKFNDERVIAQQHKIASEAFQLVWLFLLLSVLYKQFLLNEPFSAYMTEFAAFFGGSIYIVIRNSFIGNDTVDTQKRGIKIYLLNSLMTSIVITIITGTSIFTKYPQNQENLFFFGIALIIIFSSAFAMTFLCFWGVGWFSKKQADKIAKQYDEKE